MYYLLLIAAIRENWDKLPCGLSMMYYPETCWKPPETGRRGFRQVSGFFNFFLIKLAGNLPKTCWKPLGPVSGGFQRFPDNPSLTNHMVCINQITVFNFLVYSVNNTRHTLLYIIYLCLEHSIFAQKFPRLVLDLSRSLVEKINTTVSTYYGFYCISL